MYNIGDKWSSKATVYNTFKHALGDYFYEHESVRLHREAIQDALKHTNVFLSTGDKSHLVAIDDILDKEDKRISPIELIIASIVNDNLEEFKRLVDKYDVQAPKVLTEAIKYNSIEMLDYALSKGYPKDSYSPFLAAKLGNLEALKCLHEHFNPFLANVCTQAAKRGDLVMLKWLHENGYPWDCNTILEAAKLKDPACYEYALMNDCPIN